MAISRQHYGLGSLVKSIGKGVKKFVKSPLGKAAILGIGAFGLPGTSFKGLGGGLGSFFGKGSWNPLAAGTWKQGMKEIAPSKFGAMLGGMGTGTKLGIGSGLLTWLMSEQGMTEDEATAATQNPDSLKAYLKLYHSELNPGKKSKEVDEWVNINMLAKGGRVGLQGGGMDASQDDFKTPSAPPPGHPEFNIGAGGGVTTIDTGGGTGGDSNKPNIIRRAAENPVANMLASYLLPQTKMKKAWDMLNFVNTVGKVKDEDLIYGHKYEKGGRVGLYAGTPEDTAQAAGILGNLPVRQNKAGVNELDLRETGGFIPPVGVKEKADDVPAMLSNNEFVFTADAVRAAGGGSVNKGAQVLYDKMKQLEGHVV